MKKDEKRKYTLDSKVSTFNKEKAIENAKGNEDLVKFAYNLCVCLDKNNENESDLASKTGIGKASINAYIKAEQIPNIDKLIIIAKHFKVSTDYLLGFTDLPSINEDYQNVHNLTGLSEDAITILKEHLENHKDAVKNEKQQSVFSDIIDTINYLIENEPKYYFFRNLHSYLWLDIIHKDAIEKKKKIYDEDLEFSYYYDRLSNFVKIEIDKTLFKIKEEINKNKK